jgi:hypothetical protein
VRRNLVSDSAVFDQAVAKLRGMREEMSCATGVVATQMLQGWMEAIDLAIGDLLEAERRARYQEVFAVGAALVDVTVEGPPGSQAVNRERQASVLT